MTRRQNMNVLELVRNPITIPTVILLVVLGIIPPGSVAHFVIPRKPVAPLNLTGADKNYLYVNGTEPILDFHGDSESDPVRPSFIYGPDNAAARVVEFYHPQCSHCRAFRDRYVSLGKLVIGLAVDAGVHNVRFHAVSCKMNADLCSALKLVGYPHLLLFRSGRSIPIELKSTELHPLKILNELNVTVETMKLGGTGNVLTTVETENEAPILDSIDWLLHGGDDGMESGRSKRQYFDDAHYAFHYTLRKGVFQSSPFLDHPAKKALKAWLELLKRTLPFEWKVQILIRQLLEGFELITTGEESLHEMLDRFPPPKPSPYCLSRRKNEAFVCGAWELFHILSVGLMEWNKLQPPGSNGRMGINANECSGTLRDFIYYFYPCDTCRESFISDYDKCAADRCNRISHILMETVYRELPLWLWDYHNFVTERIVNESASQSYRSLTSTVMEIPRTKWPHDCSSCWKDDNTWDSGEVYKVLRTYYWRDDNTTIGLRRELGVYDGGAKRAKREKDLVWLVIIWTSALLVIGCIFLRKKISRDRYGFRKKLDSS